VNGGALRVMGNLTAGSISLDATTLTLPPAAHVTAAAVTLAANGAVTELGNPTLQRRSYGWLPALAASRWGAPATS